MQWFEPMPLDSPQRPWGQHVLPQLADPASYVACSWDLRDGSSRRDYWLDLFRRHFPSMLDEAVAEAVSRGEDRDDARHRALVCRQLFEEYLVRLAEDPGRYGRLDILEICLAREQVLRNGGFPDPYRLAKERENAAAVKLLPAVLAEVDRIPDPQRAVRLIEGIFAGNIFDLGATQTAALFENGKSVDFHQVRQKLPTRPWLIDDLDRWTAAITRNRPYRAAVVFVDNAGSDIMLGMIPFIRDLLGRGVEVIMTANTYPSLNDVTAEELTVMMAAIARWEPRLGQALQDGRLEIVASGNGAPLIDLTHISPELAAATRRRDVDLVVLEGMGRAIESNLHAAFRCDALKLAMVKDQGVAEALAGKVYDVVIRFDAAAR